MQGYYYTFRTVLPECRKWYRIKTRKQWGGKFKSMGYHPRRWYL